MNTPKQPLHHHAGWMAAIVLGSATMADAQQTFSNFQSASVAVGQANFTDAYTTASQSVTNGPVSVAISATGKMAVGDAAGSRVLIWNSIPATSGVPADVVVGKPNFTSTTIGTTASLTKAVGGVAFSPDGNKLIVCDRLNSRVLIWNSIPTTNGQPADVVVGQTNFTEGFGLLNASGLNWPGGVMVTPNGKLVIADTYFNRVLIYNSIPTSNGAAANVVIGQANMTSLSTGSGANQMDKPHSCAYTSDGKLLVADSNNNRVLVFDSLPTTNGAAANAVIGQASFGVSTGGTTANALSYPIGVAVSPSGQLAIGDYSNHRTLIYNSIPSANGAAADIVLGQPDFTSNTALNGGRSDQSMATCYQPTFAPDGRLLVPGRDMNRVMIFGSSAIDRKYSIPAPPTGGQFGHSVSVSGGLMAVGAPYDDTGASDSGKVFIYDLGSTTPTTPIHTLNNPTPAADDRFGRRVAISGRRVVVAAATDDTIASNSGTVYVYDIASGTPTIPVATLNNPGPAADDQFGWSVAISGSKVVVGAIFDDVGSTDGGSAYVYDLDGATPTVPWITLNNPFPGPLAGDNFGVSAAISGARVIIGANGDDPGANEAGSAYVYDLNGGTPAIPVITLNNPSPATADFFGTSVSISGTFAVVGANQDDIGTADAGSVYVYDLNSGTPSVPVRTLSNPTPAATDEFGWSVGISGKRIVVGVPNDELGAGDAGCAYFYDLDGATPGVPVAALNNPTPASGDQFGLSVAIDGGNVVIGAHLDDTVATDAGHAYVFSSDSTTDTPWVTINWATVGNINNPNDPADGDYFTSGAQNFGSVGHVYQIGRHEVTIGQYAAFLNKAAKSDPYGLWNPAMQSEPKTAGISRAGADGSYSYAVMGAANRPITYVSWFDAARFANWMHNGQGSGSTETGAYTLNGATSGIIAKNTAATVWIPSENEWYKAAYYDPTSGAGGGDNYWTFPIKSNTLVNNSVSANYFDVDYVGSGTSSSPTGNALTNVGAYAASASYYGTFDQGGNVTEWNDAVISGSSRVERGGAWNNYGSDLAPQARIPSGPSNEYYDKGFRLAGAVPVVADFVTTPASPRPNQSVNFDASSSSPAEGIVSYSWNWGDGSPAGTGATPNHSYANAGTYTVTLTVTDSLGATATKTSTVTAVYPVNIEWVTVGNPGNPADPATGFGAVGYSYKIGKYEVTNAQYTAFLNTVDVAGANPDTIYHGSMGTDARGGITFNPGAANGSKYVVIANMADKPVNFVSWYDAARFANWINNDQVEGATETGSYTLTGNSGIITKNTNVKVWIPTEDEWYKAAHYDPTPAAGGGDSYWLFPTRSDSAPTFSVATALGGVSNAGSNVANYDYCADWNGLNGNVTTVGGTGSYSYYGAYDQGGNLWEWNDAVISGSSRGMRGGSWDNNDSFLRSTFRNSQNPISEYSSVGFRLASVYDATPPVISPVAISSSNGGSPAWAKLGDTVTITLTANEPIQTPAVTLLGSAATATNTGGNSWSASATVGAGASEGAAVFSITATDMSGNIATVVTASTDSSSVTVDRTAPVPGGLSNMSVPATSAAGAAVTFSPTATDNLDASPAVNSTPSSGSVFPIGVTTVNVTATDAAGNSAAGSFTVTVTNASNAPHFATAGSVPVSTGGFNATGMSVGAMTLGFAPAPGAVLTLIDNTSGNPITGAFTDLADGGTLVTGFGGNSYRFIANYSGGDGNDLTLTLLAPEIVVELPVGTDVADGGSKGFGTLLLGGSADLAFTIKNTGPGILNGLAITRTGTDEAMFSVTSSPVGPLDDGETTAFKVRFTPTISGAKTATIHIASDDADENPFDIALTGQALSTSDDTDGDGLNDAAEFKLADLGYNWQVGQPALVNTLMANANLGGLYTQSQVQALHIGTPLISRNPASGKFTLLMDWKKSTDLQNFTDFPAQGSGVSVNPSGDILFEFTSPDDAAFFRLEAE